MFGLQVNRNGAVHSSPSCSMEGISRRDALGSMAGVVLGLGFAPLRVDAQYIMSGKEKAGQRKGPRYAIVYIC